MPRGHTVVVPLRLFAVTHDQHIDRCHSEHVFAMFSNDIFTFLHRSNSPPENSLWKCDPHAGWESHFLKQTKKVTHAWTAQMAKLAISFGNCLGNMFFSSILTAEVLKNAKLALPRSTGINKKTLPTEHGDYIFNICNTPSARMRILTNALCKNWCPNAPYETSKIAIFH